MIDEKLLEPSREHLARLGAQIKAMEAETAEKARRYPDDKQYVRSLWDDFYRAAEPLRREQEAFGKIIADYYGLQAAPPRIVISR